MKKLKVLIVEDEVIIALQLRMCLSRKGYDLCQFVTSGEKAIEQVRAENPDVVLMDIRLAGEMDGIEAAREITGFSSCCVIFMTGYSEDTIKKRAMLLNPAAYLNKPADIEKLDSVIMAHFKKNN